MIGLDPQALARALGGEAHGNRVLAPGPGHSKEDRSLSILCSGADFVVHSFAGDDPIVCKDFVREKAGLCSWTSRKSFTGEPERLFRSGGPQPKTVPIEYIYYDPNGRPSRKVVRTADKQFPQYRWTGSNWQLGVKGVPLYPYRLQDVIASDTVFVVEGEKDVERLAKLGFTATTNPMGAGKWTADLDGWFVGKKVYVIPDNDEPGLRHARDVARHLLPHAAEVRLLELPGLSAKEDVSDWFDRNPDNANVLVDLAEAAPLWREPLEIKPNPLSTAARGIVAADLQSMAFPPIRYVVEGYVVEGLTILAGKPKVGKSWLCMDIAVAVAIGGVTLGKIQCKGGDVLYAALEDNERRLQRRMARVLPSQAWPERLTFWTKCPTLDSGGVDAIRSWITGTGEPRLVIIDVFARVRPLKHSNETQYDADYRAVSGLHALASETGVAIVIVSHVRKMDAEDPLDTVSGTLGFTGAADSVLVLDRTSQGVTLYGRGRDIEEIETALRFEKDLCRWTILGAAEEVHRSGARHSILKVLGEAGEPLGPSDLATEAEMEPNNVKQLLRKMVRAGEVEKIGRGQYRVPGTPDNFDNFDNFPHGSG